jgi:predicted DNA-binding ribbon-helix-helix protein
MAKDLKRSLSIKGHRTSISLEPEFWDALRTIAATRHLSLAELVSEIDATRGERNLSSAIRVHILLNLIAPTS